MLRERITLCLLLTLTFAIRAIHPDQPIVENYVGRQIPTAMVARNLDRGSGFLNPLLDTAPFPNRFLVEPPIYAQVVITFKLLSGFVLEPSGRLVSALGTTLAAWGLFGLVRRREGFRLASFCLVAFASFPVMVRYGRAFQPDALMLGFVLAGLRCWDEFEASSDRGWAILGGFVLATGLALKVTSAWALIPFGLIVTRLTSRQKLALSLIMLAPALAWYVYAWGDVSRTSGGSLAPSVNASIWIRTVSPSAWVRFSTYNDLVRNLVVRAFTPVGFVLAVVGLVFAGKVDRLWVGWGVGCLASFCLLAAKWHHGYYWMVVAPLAAVGAARGFVLIASRHWTCLGTGISVGFLVCCVLQGKSTFQTPAEWAAIEEAARTMPATGFEGYNGQPMLVAPEALLYAADRTGFRLEINPEASRRAAAEWGLELQDADRPLALVEFYRGRANSGWGAQGAETGDRHGMPPYGGSIIVVDVGLVENEPRRRAFREALRAKPKVDILADRPGYLIVDW